MDLQEIEVQIDKNGQIHIHVRGVKGEACLDITQALEEALGGAVIDRKMTPEALDAPVNIDQSIKVKSAKI